MIMERTVAKTDAALSALKASGMKEGFFSPTKSNATGKTVPARKPSGKIKSELRVSLSAKLYPAHNAVK